MDPRAKFSKVYHYQVEKIYRFIFFKVESKETAEDLTSEVFRKAWVVYQASLDPASAQEKIKNLRAFLYQLARNIVVDHYRYKAKHNSVSGEDMEIADDQQNPEEIQDIRLDIERIQESLKALKDEYREVIVQHYLNNLSLREIAQDTHQSLTAVKTTLFRARQALKAALKE